MIYINTRCCVSAIRACAVIAFAAALGGCQPATIVARVNGTPISQEDYYKQLITIGPQDFGTVQSTKLDAGALTMVRMVHDMLTDQCAKDTNPAAAPSEDDIRQYVELIKRMRPQVLNDINSGQVTEAYVDRQVRTQLETLEIGTDGAKPDEKELQAEYDDLAAKKGVEFPTVYTLQFVLAPDIIHANAALDRLKQDNDFKAAIQAAGQSPEAADTAGTPTRFASNQFTKTAAAELDKVPLQQYTPEPIDVTQPANPASPGAPPPQQEFLVAKVVSREPGRTGKMQELRPMLAQRILSRKYPQWNLHAESQIGAFTLKAKIEILIDRYKPLLPGVILQNARQSVAMGAAQASPIMPSGITPAGPAPGTSGGAPAGGTPPNSGTPEGAGGAPKVSPEASPHGSKP